MFAQELAALESLGKALLNQFDPLVPVFVLVDPLLGEPDDELNESLQACDSAHAAIEARSAFWKADVFPVALDEAMGVRTGRQPYLVECLPERRDMLIATLRMALQERSRALATGLAPYRIGGWLQSASAPERLCQALAELCRLRTRPDRLTPAKYLRVADRRVLGLLCHVVGSEQIMGRLPGLDHWSWLDDSGELRAIARTQRKAFDPIVFDNCTWPRMDHGTGIHVVRARLIGMAPGAEAGFERIESALDRARHFAARWPLRFTSARDVQDWALLELLYGDLTNHPQISRILAHGDPDFPEGPDDPPEPFHLLMDAAAMAVPSTRAKSRAFKNPEMPK